MEVSEITENIAMQNASTKKIKFFDVLVTHRKEYRS